MLVSLPNQLIRPTIELISHTIHQNQTGAKSLFMLCSSNLINNVRKLIYGFYGY